MDPITIWCESDRDDTTAWFEVTTHTVTYHRARTLDFGRGPETRALDTLDISDYDASHHERVWGVLFPAAVATLTGETREDVLQCLAGQAGHQRQLAQQAVTTEQYLAAVVWQATV